MKDVFGGEFQDIASAPVPVDCSNQIDTAVDVLANAGDLTGPYGGFSPTISKQIASHRLTSAIRRCQARVQMAQYKQSGGVVPTSPTPAAVDFTPLIYLVAILIVVRVVL